MSWAVSGGESTFRRSAPERGTQLTAPASGVRFFGPADRSDRLAPIKLISMTVHNATCDVHVHSPGQRSAGHGTRRCLPGDGRADGGAAGAERGRRESGRARAARPSGSPLPSRTPRRRRGSMTPEDRKSTRLNSSHMSISYAVFCLKKKKSHNDTL